VGVGAIFASFVRVYERLGALDAALLRHGVARTPSDLGLEEDEFAAAVAHAPSTRPDRYTILEHLDLDERAIAERVRSFVNAVDR
jgi:glycerol-1-phosphate dehydrogenase [NAD(P)+]